MPKWLSAKPHFRNDTAKIGVISTPWRLVSFFDFQSPLSLKFSCEKGHVVTGRVNIDNRKFRREYFHLLGQSMFPNSIVSLNQFGLDCSVPEYSTFKSNLFYACIHFICEFIQRFNIQPSSFSKSIYHNKFLNTKYVNVNIFTHVITQYLQKLPSVIFLTQFLKT